MDWRLLVEEQIAKIEEEKNLLWKDFEKICVFKFFLVLGSGFLANQPIVS